jgi:hypothetical protein
VKLLTVSQNGGSTIIIIIISNRGKRKEKKIETKSISLGSNRVEQLYLEISF